MCVTVMQCSNPEPFCRIYATFLAAFRPCSQFLFSEATQLPCGCNNVSVLLQIIEPRRSPIILFTGPCLGFVGTLQVKMTDLHSTELLNPTVKYMFKKNAHTRFAKIFRRFFWNINLILKYFYLDYKTHKITRVRNSKKETTTGR